MKELSYLFFCYCSKPTYFLQDFILCCMCTCVHMHVLYTQSLVQARQMVCHGIKSSILPTFSVRPVEEPRVLYNGSINDLCQLVIRSSMSEFIKQVVSKVKEQLADRTSEATDRDIHQIRCLQYSTEMSRIAQWREHVEVASSGQASPTSSRNGQRHSAENSGAWVMFYVYWCFACMQYMHYICALWPWKSGELIRYP